MAMRGTPVDEEAVSSMLPMQKQREMRKMKPVMKPRKTDMTMARGACLRASLISSVM